MNEQHFKEKYESEKNIFEAWGNFVNTEILNSLVKANDGLIDINLFLKIPSSPRVKNTESIISKAFYRGKQYHDPYTEITDKVGIRYVVLLQKDIKTICEIVENFPQWKHSKDRDFEAERVEKPFTFDYQSVHYIVYCQSPQKYDRILIPKDTPCEIQIRTLLQHAYTELTHDTIYKPKAVANPSVLRLVGKSMALIETTDGIFEDVSQILEASIMNSGGILEELMKIYEEFTSSSIRASYEKKLNSFLLDALSDVLADLQIGDIKKFLFEDENNSFLKKIILDRQNSLLLYKQPVVILLYYLIKKKRFQLRNVWPLSDDEIRPLFTDMGISFD
jgi:putative GTP pyrophosphokinase